MTNPMEEMDKIAEQKGWKKEMCTCGFPQSKAPYHEHSREREIYNEGFEAGIQKGKEEGELLFISEMMNRHKTPHWISIIPKEMEISSEKLFSFSEEYAELREQQARNEALEEVLKKGSFEIDKNGWMEITIHSDTFKEVLQSFKKGAEKK